MVSNLISLFEGGGFVMYPLLICSFAIWAVIFERFFRYRKMGDELKAFQLEASNNLLRGDPGAIQKLCEKNPNLPTARLLAVAVDRLQSKDRHLKEKWQEAVERQRQLENLDLKKHLWVLGTIGSSAPFIGLFGTVVGILRSFGDIAESGKGGFAIVAAGISEALIATAAGIIVAVIAVMAFNAFQTRWSSLVVEIRIHVEEFVEILEKGLAGATGESSGN